MKWNIQSLTNKINKLELDGEIEVVINDVNKDNIFDDFVITYDDNNNRLEIIIPLDLGNL